MLIYFPISAILSQIQIYKKSIESPTIYGLSMDLLWINYGLAMDLIRKDPKFQW
jgi:hypothetical protein